MLLRITVVVTVLLALTGAYLFSYPDPPVDPAWAIPAATEIPPDAVTVRFTGTSTLLFDDGETAWMVDGWFTRPSIWALAAGRIAPDPEAVTQGLARNGVKRLAAVIPVHSHYDHAMDAPEVALQTGARVIGSESTANIARGWSVPEEQIQAVADREVVGLGKFRITFIESRHFLFPDPEMAEAALLDPEITQPLVPPVSVFDYRLGKAYVLHVDHPAGRFAVIGSAGFIPGLLENFQSDVLFLGVGGLGSQSDAYREAFWRYTVEAMEPERIVAIHWDSLLGPVEGEFTGEMRIFRALSGGADNTLAFLRDKAATNTEVPLQTLPRFDPVRLF